MLTSEHKGKGEGGRERGGERGGWREKREGVICTLCCNEIVIGVTFLGL